MNDVPSYIKRAAEQSGFQRTRYDESKMPSSPKDICVMMFFGDIRSTCILSSILLKRYREQFKGSKYFILCSWPGYEGMFPYVDEYWEIKNQDLLLGLYQGTQGFENNSGKELPYRRKLNWFFEDVIDASVLEKYYNNGIQQEFWNTFKHVQRTLPSIPSINIMGQEFIRQLTSKEGNKALIHPAKYIQHWKNGRIVYTKSHKDFWVKLSKTLIENNITPVIYHNFFTHDLSTHLTNECIYITEHNITKLLGVMRYIGCVIDIGSGVSRLAIAARTPFIYCDERSRHVELKEYEIDGLCCEKTIPREYIFTFATILNNENENLWKLNFFDNIVIKLKQIIQNTNKDYLPSTSESTVMVPYEEVRKRKMTRLGTKFIKVQQD